MCGEVAASSLCFSRVNKHFIQGGSLLTNQVVTIPRSWIQGHVCFTVPDMTREASLLLEILRNKTKQPAKTIAPFQRPKSGKSILRLLLRQTWDPSPRDPISSPFDSGDLCYGACVSHWGMFEVHLPERTSLHLLSWLIRGPFSNCL